MTLFLSIEATDGVFAFLTLVVVEKKGKRIPYLEDTLGVWLFSSGKGSDSSEDRKPEVTLKKAALT